MKPSDYIDKLNKPVKEWSKEEYLTFTNLCLSETLETIADIVSLPKKDRDDPQYLYDKIEKLVEELKTLRSKK